MLVIAFLLVLPVFSWIAWGAWQDGEYGISVVAAFVAVVLLISVLGYWRDTVKDKRRERAYRDRMIKALKEMIEQESEE